MAKLVIFDMDQTLLDLVPIHDKAYSRVFKEIFGVETTFNKIDHSGKSYPVITRILGELEGVDKNKIEQKIPEVLSLFKKYFNEIVSKMKVEPLSGAKELLEKLYSDKEKCLKINDRHFSNSQLAQSLKQNCKELDPIGNKNNILVVASASPGDTVKLSLKNAGLLHFFKEIKTADDAEVKKGIVQILKNQLDKNNQMKTFMIGDAVEDMDAGKNINATAIGLTTGSHSEKELKEHGANFVFSKIEPDKILKIIGA